MERCIGNNSFQDNYNDFWAIGYAGDFYVATFDNVPDSFQWRFDISDPITISNCDTNTGVQLCNCESNNVFDVSCKISGGRLITTMKLASSLNSSYAEVVIRQLDVPDNFLTQTISASG